MKSNIKPWLYGPNWQGLRCEARTRNGTPCRRPGTKQNGRCRFHGGRSVGLRFEEGFARMIALKITHSRFTKAEGEKAKHRAEVGRQVMRELKKVEQWAINHGHLVKNWRDQLK